MRIINVPFERLNPVYQASVLRGYEWGCECGEGYATQLSAELCPKCRKYLADRPAEIYYTKMPEQMTG